MSIDPELVKQLAEAVTDDPDILDEKVLGSINKQVKSRQSAPKTRRVMAESTSGATFLTMS